MIVFIEGNQEEYFPDYNENNPNSSGWRIQNVDAFKFATLGKTKVFIKRFKKSLNGIPGYQLLKSIKGQKLIGLPEVYDIVASEENGTHVVYLFMQYIEGKTLEDFIQQRLVLNLNPNKFVEQIHTALTEITKRGFWFSDFVEKNIFISNNGDFYLIDIDSATLLSILPLSDDKSLSRVSLNYSGIIASKIYKDRLNYPFQNIKNQLLGNTMNFLQLLLMLAVFKEIFDRFLLKQNIHFLDQNTRYRAVTKLFLSPHANQDCIKSYDFKTNSQNLLTKEDILKYVNYFFKAENSNSVIFCFRTNAITSYKKEQKQPDGILLSKLLKAFNVCLDELRFEDASKNLSLLKKNGFDIVEYEKNKKRLNTRWANWCKEQKTMLLSQRPQIGKVLIYQLFGFGFIPLKLEILKRADYLFYCFSSLTLIVEIILLTFGIREEWLSVVSIILPIFVFLGMEDAHRVCRERQINIDAEISKLRFKNL